MNILITGIKGFIGSNLYQKLQTKHTIIGLGSKNEENIIPRIYTLESVNLIKDNIDIIICCHAAVSSGNIKIDNETLFKINVNVTESLLEKFKNATFVYISTSSIYSNENIITENSSINPTNPYSLSKLWAENLFKNYTNHVILRLSSVYGIGMKEVTLIPNYINQALNENKISIWGKGNRLQNYIHIEDVCEYICKIIENKEVVMRKTLLGVSTNEYSNFEIAKFIANITNSKIEFVNEDFSNSNIYNNKKTLDLLKWEPTRNIFTEVENYIRWKNTKLLSQV